LKRFIENQSKEISSFINQSCDLYDETLQNYESALKCANVHLKAKCSELKEEKNKQQEIVVVLKKERVNDQKKILDLQRRLGFAMEEYEQDKSKLIKGDTLMGVDLNSDENYMKSKVDDIMTNLKDKILASSRIDLNDAETNKFINKISIANSPKRSVDTEKKFESVEESGNINAKSKA